jgi:hypothetical protein
MFVGVTEKIRRDFFPGEIVFVEQFNKLSQKLSVLLVSCKL